MKITPLCSVVDRNGVHPPGCNFEVSEEIGKELVKNGYAIELYIRSTVPAEKEQSTPPKHKKKK